MKTNTRIFSLFIVLLFAISFTSCEDDDLDGMFGDPVENFLGTWNCFEEGDIFGDFGPFTVEIIRNPENSSEVLIKNFNYQGMDVSARAIIAGNTITIPRQDICDDTIEIKGSGTFVNREINLTYTTDDKADLENIVARFYK